MTDLHTGSPSSLIHSATFTPPWDRTPRKILGWPKTLFGFFQRSLKPQKNFLANTVLALMTLFQSACWGAQAKTQAPAPAACS